MDNATVQVELAGSAVPLEASYVGHGASLRAQLAELQRRGERIMLTQIGYGGVSRTSQLADIAFGGHRGVSAADAFSGKGQAQCDDLALVMLTLGASAT